MSSSTSKISKTITLFGGTGRTGQYLLPDLLARGYTVFAVVRTPSKIPEQLVQQYPEQLTVVHALVSEPDKYETCIAQSGAVVSALGFDNNKATTELSEGMRNIIACMKRHNVKRILAISSAGCNPDDPQLPYLFKWVILPYVLYENHEELKRMEQEILNWEHDLEYSILRPPRLLLGEKTEVYRSSVEGLPKGGAQINRSDLAYATANILENNKHLNQVVYIAN